MGDISRSNRADRFIKEFSKDLEAKSEFKVGQKLEVVEVYVGPKENSGYEVVEQMLVRDVKTQKSWTMETDRWMLFDPECWTEDDVVSRLREDLGIGKKQAIARLKKARLF